VVSVASSTAVPSAGFNGDRLDSKRLQDQYLDEGEGNIVASSLLLRDDIDA